MSSKLYSRLSEVCHVFYRLYFPHTTMAAQLEKHDCRKIVFFGGCIYVAELLHKKGFDITYVEYTEEMMHEAQKVLHDMPFFLSKMRTLVLDDEYDAIVLMGRIFTYLPTDADVQQTLVSFANHLKTGGILMMDNYEEGKIDTGPYFTGTISLHDKTEAVDRISSLQKIQTAPSLYQWNCVYEHSKNGKLERFEDLDHILRAFGKAEIEKLLRQSPLKFVEHTDNFEEISFVTIAQKD